MGELVNRRQFLKILASAGLAALVPDAVKSVQSISETKSEFDSDIKLAGKAAELIHHNKRFDPFIQLKTPEGYDYYSPGGEGPKISPGADSSFLLPSSHHTFRYTVTGEEMNKLCSSVPTNAQAAMKESFVVTELPPERTVLLVGDSFILWRNMPLLLQHMLALSGFNIAVETSAVFGTGPGEAYWRIQNSSILQEVAGVEVIHGIHASTDFVPDMMELHSPLNSPKANDPA